MKGRHHTPEQVIRKLAEGEKLLAQGKSIEEVALDLTGSTDRLLVLIMPPDGRRCGGQLRIGRG